MTPPVGAGPSRQRRYSTEVNVRPASPRSTIALRGAPLLSAVVLVDDQAHLLTSIGANQKGTARILVVVLFCLLTVFLPLTAASVTVTFEGTGVEEGITELGATNFTISGVSFHMLPGIGGVDAPADSALLSSGNRAFQAAGTDHGLMIEFTDPVESVSFFFVHPTTGVHAGQALVIGAGGSHEFLRSRLATTMGDPANVVMSTLGEPITRVMIRALPAYIDDFRFSPVPVPEPSTGLLVALGLIGLASRRSLEASGSTRSTRSGRLAVSAVRLPR